jgi:hypothetical protein
MASHTRSLDRKPTTARTRSMSSRRCARRSSTDFAVCARLRVRAEGLLHARAERAHGVPAVQQTVDVARPIEQFYRRVEMKTEELLHGQIRSESPDLTRHRSWRQSTQNRRSDTHRSVECGTSASVRAIFSVAASITATAGGHAACCRPWRGDRDRPGIGARPASLYTLRTAFAAGSDTAISSTLPSSAAWRRTGATSGHASPPSPAPARAARGRGRSAEGRGNCPGPQLFHGDSATRVHPSRVRGSRIPGRARS